MGFIPWVFAATAALGLGLQLESIALVLAACCLTWGATLKAIAP